MVSLRWNIMTDWCNAAVYPFSWSQIWQELEQLENSPSLANICFLKYLYIFPFCITIITSILKNKDVTQINTMEIVHLNYAFSKIMQMPPFLKHFAFYSVLPFVVFQAGIQQWQAPIFSLLGDTFKSLSFNLIFNAILKWMYLINIQLEVLIEVYCSMSEIINVPMLL